MGTRAFRAATRVGLAVVVLWGGAAAVPAGARDAWPTKQRWKRAFLGAVRDPGTWVPAAGAVVFSLGDLDERLSDWAVREAPVFGSARRADSGSDRLRGATHAGMVLSGLLAPSERGLGGRAERLLIQHAAATATGRTTGWLKRRSGRLRPDGSDRLSFPSGHTSRAFGYATLAAHNVGTMDLPPPLSRGLRIGLYSLAAGTAWARVEAGAHYPSDVLAGAALGSFASRVIQDAFLGEDSAVLVGIELDPERPEFWIRWRF